MKFKILCFIVLSIFINPAMAADVYLSLSAHGERMELGVSGFVPVTDKFEEAKMCKRLYDVLRNDLVFSRYFNLIEGGPIYTGKDSELLEWQNHGANVLVCGKVKMQGNNITLTGQLMDIGSKQIIWEKNFKGSIENCRYIAHRLNDEVIERFTGEKGIAHTKIAFVNNQTKYKELYLIDYDGYNLRRLTTDYSINILPKWSPLGDEIIYTTYRYGNPDLYSLSIFNNYKRAVSSLQGLNSAGSFSPNGTNIALTISDGHMPNLYLISRFGKIIKRLTTTKTIETSPSFAPNGREIVYISDRPGYPQLYIMDVEGSNVRRLPTGGYCDSPAWSPRGDKIVFTMRQGSSNYDLYIYDLASNRTSRLTQSDKNNENPSWSPDGRFIVFSSRKAGKSELYIIAADGSGLRKLAEIQGQSYMPSWEP